MLEQALQYHSYGLQVLPAANKFPRGAWKKYQSQFMTPLELRDYFAAESNKQPIEQICLVVGKVSGGLEVIDIDSKYDNTGKLFENLKGLIDDNLPELADAFVIDQTPSGGYHIYYRCEVIEGNKKLARRLTTEEERQKKPDEKVLVLVETRGQGGIIIVPPTKGYTLLQGSFAELPTITPEQRECLLSICRSFNEEPETQPRPTYQTNAGAATREGLSPFADYNQKGDVVSLLERHGWKYVSTQGQKIQLKRPGESQTKTSGNFHEGLRKFYVFSSSTEFEPEKAYSPADVFILLECNNDKSEAARKLLASGYGTPSGAKQRVTRNETPNSRVDYVNAEGGFEPLSTDNVLTEEKAKSAVTDGLFIYFTTDTPKPEIFQSLALLEQTSSAPIYLVEVASLASTNEPLITYRPSEFKAQDIISRYAEVYELNGQSTDPVIDDGFIREFISTGQTITDPFEKDRFKALFLRFSQDNDLSITPESIKAVEDQLTYNRQREAQNQSLTDLIEKAGKLQQKGDLSGALKLLSSDSKNLSTQNQADTFKVLTTPIKESEMRERIQKKSVDLKTGYIIEGEELLLPAGAITILAAPTSHGKTTFLLNLALRATTELFEKSIYVLSFEEDADSVTISAMNTYIGAKLSINNRRSIRSYYQDENNHYIYKDQVSEFESLKNKFFTDLIYPGRLSIQYVEYDADTLNDAIRYLHQNGNAGAVFIDYVQLLRKANSTKTRQEELKQICLDLKDVAVETGLPLILGAQFNREVVNAARLHPTKIGEAGDIERAANVILGFWNNHFPPLAAEDELETLNNLRGDPHALFVNLLKNRGGQVGLTGMLSFDGNAGLISNYTDSFIGSSRIKETNRGN